jgi:Tol biopolymer transport system component
MNGGAVLRVLRNGLIFLFLLCPVICVGKSPDHIGSVAVSPDGKLIAVDVEKGGTSFIHKIAVDTGNATRLTNAKTGEESMPAFSPDGKRIAFSYSPGNGVHSSIVIGNVDGSSLRPWSPSESNDFSPVFSPDNKTIFFLPVGILRQLLADRSATSSCLEVLRERFGRHKRAGTHERELLHGVARFCVP